MEVVEAGYKNTEVGLIPEDWVFISVGEAIEQGLIEKPIDGNHGNIHPKKSDFVTDGIPFIMANNVSNGRLDLKYCAFISKDQADSLQKGFAYSGDVLLTHKGTVGEVALVEDIFTPYIMLTPQVTYYRVKNGLTNMYLKSYFESSTFQKVLSSLSGGGTRAYIGIVKQKQLPLIFPPTLTEQKAIATALSDVDALISSLDKLIEKKKAIKQGAMQELLTPPDHGGKRLEGFSGEWDTVNLGDITSIQTGKMNNQDKEEDGIYPFFVRSQTVERINRYSYDEEAILVPGEGNIGRIFHHIIGKFEVHQRVYRIHNFHERVSGRFIYYMLIDGFYDHAMTNTVKATVDSLRLPTFQNFPLCIPNTLNEQLAIVEILDDIQHEIRELKIKRDKYNQIKQGMMQELLTGKTRLI